MISENLTCYCTTLIAGVNLKNAEVAKILSHALLRPVASKSDQAQERLQ
jgi:hypothetical protein